MGSASDARCCNRFGTCLVFSMLLVFADRHELIALLGSGAVSTMVELGVYEGEFAAHCRRVLSPGRYTLIDHWDYQKYSFVLEDAPQSRHVRSIFNAYFHGDPQVALRAAYEKVLVQFQDDPNVDILRLDISEAADRFPDGSLDIIYLDGSHTYEYVLRDLHQWFPKLSPGGLFICNDFFESPAASLQNIGVIPAVLTFAKRHPVHPIVLAASDWSDFYFSNQPASLLIDKLLNGVFTSGRNVVDIPIELLGAYHHRLITLPNGRQCLLPSFSSR